MTEPTVVPQPIGWPLLPQPNGAGRLTYPTLAESVRQSIKIILSTRPGEQLMRPDFGAGLENYLHEPNTLTTRRILHDAIIDALARWEPRIVVDRVDVAEMPAQPSRLRVELSYRIRRTGRAETLGMTLESGG